MKERAIAIRIRKLATQYPVVTVTGPRQSGKTTLAKMLFPTWAYVNLEALNERQFAQEDPIGFLRQFEDGSVVIDEVQRVPELLSQIQVMVDADPRPGRFLLTGSQNFSLSRGISQSLAGRTALCTLLPFSLSELGTSVCHAGLNEMLFKGFYPKIHDRGVSPADELSFYVQTYLERDVREVENVRNLRSFSTFLRLTAGRTGQVLNVSSLAADAGISPKVASEWLSILEASYIVRLLEPWYANLNKRLTKAPKLYFTDVGLAAHLIGVGAPEQFVTHPCRGALFETMVVGEYLKDILNRGSTAAINYYRDSNHNEIDLVIAENGKTQLVEIKSGETYSDDWMATIRRLEPQFGEKCEKAVVYGGSKTQHRSDFDLRSWRDFGMMLANPIYNSQKHG